MAYYKAKHETVGIGNMEMEVKREQIVLYEAPILQVTQKETMQGFYTRRFRFS